MSDEQLKFEAWAKFNVGQPDFAGFHGTLGVWRYYHNFVQMCWCCWSDARKEFIDER